jgi:hypothetical protein
MAADKTGAAGDENVPHDSLAGKFAQPNLTE